MVITVPPVNINYSATQFTATATFAYPDGTPLESGRAAFHMDSIANSQVAVDFANGSATALLGPFPVFTGPIIPAGSHSFAVALILSNRYANSLVQGTVKVRK
jgi:hypothetical protein